MTKQPHPEEGYFSKLDSEKRHKIAMERRAKLAREELEKLKKLHHMRCGSCGWELETVIYRGIPIHKCFHCGSALLENNAIEKFCGKDTKFIETVIDLFRF